MISILKSTAKRSVSGVRRMLNSAPSSRPMILMYHRVSTTRHDPWGLTVTPENFVEHIELIVRNRRVMSLRDFFQRFRSNTLPRGAVAITFDDGYADNFYLVAPLLKRFDIPATLFITTGYLDRPEFWWDELDRLLFLSSSLPSELDLTINGKQWLFRRPWIESLSSGRWLERQNRPSSRHKLLRQIWQQMRAVSPEAREDVLRQLRRRLSRSDDADAPFEHRPMTKEEVASFSQDELIDIGAHTLSHPKLSTQPPLAQHLEISRSKEICEELIGREVVSFSYPFGDKSAQTMLLVRRANLQLACTTRSGPVRPTDDCFDLPRFWVSNWNGEELDAKLREYS
ncbi:polysaccharide deacetylase family protein [Bradyrhizobium australiense]|uniref:Chitooligosaccharide deacetylase n=1 Tax=Bradyrhizobium australiense TaxID=2721161 RepID=A0A7Y4GNP6_9BRAD|nr:polysaccharide deacetylase family protein [Bradyrhizobium australiense]NOJ39140.1 polysaccharide deacetylase family protein [Bradyrhizobium australiense]